MSAPSSRRSPSRASSLSSGSSTPVSRRRKPQQNLNNVTRNAAFKSCTSSVRTLRRLQSNSKTAKWTNLNDNNNSNNSNVTNETINYQQQQALQIEEVTRSGDEGKMDTIPSAMISSLSLSQSNYNNSNSTTIISGSPQISDTNENIDLSTTNADITALDSKVQQNVMKSTELLKFFDECDDGIAYLCKLCKTVSNFLAIVY